VPFAGRWRAWHSVNRARRTIKKSARVTKPHTQGGEQRDLVFKRPAAEGSTFKTYVARS